MLIKLPLLSYLAFHLQNSILRNNQRGQAAHPGREIMKETQVHLGEMEVYGCKIILLYVCNIAAALYDETHFFSCMAHAVNMMY